MGRFEKQPDNLRVKGELTRAAEDALWSVVENLENLQQNVLQSLQEDVKRLQAEKNRLSDDIQRLHAEKEHLQQVRQITEQQVLIRQLAEVLAKHISSQLQSALTILATQAKEENSSEQAALKSAEVTSNAVSEINEKFEHILSGLDDNVTITFNSLQQELKNYQSNLSQQLSRMYSQQQQGEAILADFVSRLHGELERIREETSRKVVTAGQPTVLQFIEQKENTSFETSPQPGEPISNTSEAISLIPEKLSASETILQPPAIVPPPKENAVEPISLIPEKLLASETILQPPAIVPPPKQNAVEPISLIPEKLSVSETILQPPAIVPPPKQNAVEPISLIPEKLSVSETISEPPVAKTPLIKRKTAEPISLRRGLSENKTRSEPATASTPQQKAKTPPTKSRTSSGLSPIQTGFLLVLLSAVVSSLYNIAIKVIFHEGSQILGVVEVERLLPPTLGNTLLILTLRFMVVVPLMILLAPILHPRVWQDIQNLFDSLRGNSTRNNAATKQILVLSVVSGCFLFLSQVLIYTAIGQIATGMAIALFFIYPIVSGLLSWFLFRDRLNLFRIGAIVSICCGELLVLGAAQTTDVANTSLGSGAAIISGVAFAGYVILTRICASKLHPVTFTLINFTTMLALSFIGLMLPLPGSWNLVFDTSKMLELILSAVILGVMTLSAYLFNNFGISKLGASRSALIGGSIPVLTVIFAGLIIQENLDIVQILGVLLVTFGAAAFSFEKIQNQQIKSSNSTN